MNYFPDNTLTHYTTKLPKIMDLDGTWEIGLAEIQYPSSAGNIACLNPNMDCNKGLMMT
jgi:hypothetical protein